MPSSREVRARQNRQKERVAAQRAERHRQQQRRRRAGGVGLVIVIVIVLAIGLAAGGNNKGNTVAVAPTDSSTTVATTTTTPPTTVAAASVKGKPCVGLKDALPKGSPALLLGPGPAPTKLKAQDLTVGTGPVVAKNGKVTVNYVGIACTSGKIFDSSYSRNQTYDVDLTGGVIEGWLKGIPGMRIGGVRLLSIPSDLAYGSENKAALIPPDEPLFFLISAVKLG